MKFHLEPNKRVIIVLAVLCVASLGVAFYVHNWQNTQRVAWQAKQEAKKKEAADIEASANQLPETEAQLADVKERLSFLRGSPPDDFQPALLQEFTELATDCRVDVDTFSPSDDMAGGASPIAKVRKDVVPHTYVNVQVTVAGSYHDMSRFLYRISGFKKVVSVNSMQLQPQSSGSLDDVRLALQTTAYVIKDMRPDVMSAVAALKDVAAAQEKYKTAHQAYAKLDGLVAASLTSVTEGDTSAAEGYVITTDPASNAANYKILAKAVDKGSDLHDLSIDQTGKVTDDTAKAPFE